MPNTIAVRREDLSKKGEKRVAISPERAQEITSLGAGLLVQPGSHPETNEEKRIFQDELYEAVGAEIKEDLADADVIFGLKEIELAHILPEKAYLFFSHTHKGQTKNRKMLQHLIDQRASLVDYELITDEDDMRLLTAFTYFAGYAGMIDSLWTYGKRLKQKGISNPFEAIPQSIEVGDLEQIKGTLREVGAYIAEHGTPAELPPMICCFFGSGKTSTGAQEIFDILPTEWIRLKDVPEIFANGSRKVVYKVVLGISTMFRPNADAPEALKQKAAAGERFRNEYISNPEYFESNIDRIFPYSSILMNCIIWSNKYPRLLTREEVARFYAKDQVAEVLGDITCDPEGAFQFSKETWIDRPVFIYNPASRAEKEGFDGEGIAVMAVTNLPCEFSADASRQFSSELAPMLPGIATANFDAATAEEAGLPGSILRATILWKGEFREPFQYMKKFVE
jgi:alpha-aminoadipic semialdehyde synthase